MQLLKTANLNGELMYSIWHFTTFHIGAGVRLLENEGDTTKWTSDLKSAPQN